MFYRAQPKIISHPSGTLVTLWVKCSIEECTNTDKAIFDKEVLKLIRDQHVDQVLPDWEPARREMFFISGVCGECWDRIFADEEEEVE